jgi:hypothetical protein
MMRTQLRRSIRTIAPTPGWERDAVCKDADTDRFYTADPTEAAELIHDFCSVCPVIAACRSSQESLAVNDRYGVWGGRFYGDTVSQQRRQRDLYENPDPVEDTRPRPLPTSVELRAWARKHGVLVNDSGDVGTSIRKAWGDEHPDRLPHGKRNTYAHWGCRCEKCHQAQYAYLDSYRERKRAEKIAAAVTPMPAVALISHRREANVRQLIASSVAALLAVAAAGGALQMEMPLELDLDLASVDASGITAFVMSCAAGLRSRLVEVLAPLAETGVDVIEVEAGADVDLEVRSLVMSRGA